MERGATLHKAITGSEDGHHVQLAVEPRKQTQEVKSA